MLPQNLLYVEEDWITFGYGVTGGAWSELGQVSDLGGYISLLASSCLSFLVTMKALLHQSLPSQFPALGEADSGLNPLKSMSQIKILL